jgi:hypothetical protein
MRVVTLLAACNLKWWKNVDEDMTQLLSAPDKIFLDGELLNVHSGHS